MIGLLLTTLAGAATSCTTDPASEPEASAVATGSPTTPDARSAAGPSRCVVIASVSADEGVAPFEVVLTAEGLCTSAAATYVWDFGDDTPSVEAQIVTHRYDAPGNYVARVTIADAPHGVEDADEVLISVISSTH